MGLGGREAVFGRGSGITLVFLSQLIDEKKSQKNKRPISFKDVT